MLLSLHILQSLQMILEERQKGFVRVSFLRMFSQTLSSQKIKEREETGKLHNEADIIQWELEDQSQVKEQISLLLMIL